ncbi:MAG: class I SAM-dependent methyltransferase [Gaiellaceae bacterium]
MNDSTVTFTKYETRGAYHWAELAHRFPHRYSSRLHAQYDWFVDEARKRRTSLIVDVGCGDAALTYLLEQATGARVVGIEPEPLGVELAREALARVDSSVEVLQGRGEELPFADGEASLVVMSEVIEHARKADPLIDEAARVVSATGAVLLSTPQWQSDDLRELHFKEYTADELRALCAGAFEDVEVLVAEPPGLYDRYMSNPFWRVGVDVASLLGRNPFTKRLRASSGHAGWRELFAIASRPKVA